MNKKPTVSELIKLLDKPGLLYWANKIGLQGIRLQDYKAKSTEQGSNYHQELESYINSNIKIKNTNLLKNTQKFEQKYTFIDAEKTVSNEYFYGRYDVKLERKVDNKIFIADFKSNTKVYLDNILQLICYKLTQEDDCGIAVIQIPEMIFKEIEIYDIESFKKLIKGLIYVYIGKKEIELYENI